VDGNEVGRVQRQGETDVPTAKGERSNGTDGTSGYDMFGQGLVGSGDGLW
jgi:hypothetical protein